MKILIAVAACLLLSVAPPATAAEAPTVELKPGAIERGADLPDPHVEGRVIHDGSLRLAFRAPRVTLLGKVGTAYVVHLARKNGSHARVIRIRPDERSQVLVTGLDLSQIFLSADGRHLLTRPTALEDRTLLRVVHTRSGALVAERWFAGTAGVLDADEGRAVLGSWGPNRTFWWNFRTDATRQIRARVGYAADIRADRVATYTRDPYLDGCSVVSSLRSDAVLWRSCDERVAAFSPDGRRVAAIDLLSDGIGPSSVTVRRTRHGAAIARYTARWFGELVWESDTSLLLDTNGARKSATVRCVITTCERATDLEDVPRI